MSKTALLSVYDKTGLDVFARGLVRLGFKIISTGKTARFLKDTGLAVTDVSSVTGFPEILDGRVKTLHPKIHAGILARAGREDQKVLSDLKIDFIDLVVVNLYPFETTPNIENIDIGGPAMLRAAAKNFERVTVVYDIADYEKVLSALEKGETTPEFRRELAAKVFAATARYENAIADFFNPRTTNHEPRTTSLRYGENPHQSAQWSVSESAKLWEEPLQGKELSYNNILDADAVWEILNEFHVQRTTYNVQKDFVCVIVKHANPCGVALSGQSLEDAFEKAYGCDFLSAFGGIVGFNGEVDQACAQALAAIFLEVILAPGFSKQALEIFAAKKNLRLLKMRQVQPPAQMVRSAGGGQLRQDADLAMEEPSCWETKTQRLPTPEEVQALAFAWKVVKHAKSNAIVFATQDQTVGIGAGQTSRIDAVKIAVTKMEQYLARTTNHESRVVASDAFFPFPDSIEAIAKTGATAVIQPGGSIKDAEVIAAANRHNLAMVFTSVRHFRH